MLNTQFSILKKLPSILNSACSATFFSILIRAALLVLLLPMPVRADTPDKLPEDLTSIGLQKLMNLDIEVTSATRRSQKVSSIPAAIYVITGEEVRRAGVRHIAEALRLAPGVEVARINANSWAVSIRGFNQRFSGQLLVLVDGKSIFTPLFSGTFWETLDMYLDVIDRIEVIRGPGASVWGANAVNGVINIITKTSGDTQGNTISAGGGNQARFFEGALHGGTISPTTTYRITQQYTEHAANKLEGGGSAEDDWGIASFGFRSDTDITPTDHLTILADGYYQEQYLPVTVPSLSPPYTDSSSYSRQAYNHGASLSTRYQDDLGEDRYFRFNTDYIFEQREGKILPLTRHSVNFEGLYEAPITKTLEFNGGLGYRLYQDDTDGNFAEELDPSSRRLNLFNGFVQLQKSLLDDTVRTLVGVKVEQDSIGGFQAMPTARVLWSPIHSLSLWTSYSRAGTTPGRVYDDLKLPAATIPPSPTTPMAEVVALGGDDLKPTTLDAYEVGIRKQFTPSVFVDLTGFYFSFDRVLGLQEGVPFIGTLNGSGDALPLIPLYFGNSYAASSSGAELSVDWAASDSVSVSSFYSYLDLDVTGGDGTLDSEKFLKEGNSPQQTFGLRGRLRIAERLELDPTLRYVDGLSFDSIPSYWELGVRLGYKLTDDVELIIAGQDLLHASHRENDGTVFAPAPTRMERSVWGEVKVSF